jgi:hypothetical protein
MDAGKNLNFARHLFFSLPPDTRHPERKFQLNTPAILKLKGIHAFIESDTYSLIPKFLKYQI